MGDKDSIISYNGIFFILLADNFLHVFQVKYYFFFLCSFCIGGQKQCLPLNECRNAHCLLQKIRVPYNVTNFMCRYPSKSNCNTSMGFDKRGMDTSILINILLVEPLNKKSFISDPMFSCCPANIHEYCGSLIYQFTSMVKSQILYSFLAHLHNDNRITQLFIFPSISFQLNIE